MKKLLLTSALLIGGALSVCASTVNDTYTKVASIDGMTLGDEYILCYETNAMGALSGKYHVRVANGVTLDGDKATITNADVESFIIEAGSTAGTYAFKIAGKYMTCTSVSNGNLGASATLVNTADMNISFSNGTILINPNTNSNSGSNRIQYNSNSGQERFTNYKSSTQKNCTLYKKDAGGDVPPAGDKTYAPEWADMTMFAGTTFQLDLGTSHPEEILFESSDTAVATVDESTGLITAVAEGTATISALWAETGWEADETSFVVTVTDLADVMNVTVDLTAQEKNSYGNGKTVEWVSTDGLFTFTTVATIGDGRTTYPAWQTAGLRFYTSNENEMTVTMPEGWYVTAASYESASTTNTLNLPESFPYNCTQFTFDSSSTDVTKYKNLEIESMTFTITRVFESLDHRPTVFNHLTGNEIEGTTTGTGHDDDALEDEFHYGFVMVDDIDIHYNLSLRNPDGPDRVIIKEASDLEFTKYEEGEHIVVPARTDGVLSFYAVHADGRRSEIHTLAFDAGTTGVENIETSAAEAEYFNLQGIRISTPVQGQVYILCQGSKTTKIVR